MRRRCCCYRLQCWTNWKIRFNVNISTVCIFILTREWCGGLWVKDWFLFVCSSSVDKNIRQTNVMHFWLIYNSCYLSSNVIQEHFMFLNGQVQIVRPSNNNQFELAKLFQLCDLRQSSWVLVCWHDQLICTWKISKLQILFSDTSDLDTDIENQTWEVSICHHLWIEIIKQDKFQDFPAQKMWNNNQKWKCVFSIMYWQ